MSVVVDAESELGTETVVLTEQSEWLCRDRFLNRSGKSSDFLVLTEENREALEDMEPSRMT